MRIDDENKVVWCSESILNWYKTYEKESNKINFMIYHVARIGFGNGLTDKNGCTLPREAWRNIDKQSLIKAILNGYEFKLEQPKKYYWRKNKEYLAWFEEKDLLYLVQDIDDKMLDLRPRAEIGNKSKFTETEARDLLKDDFDKFEKAECE